METRTAYFPDPDRNRILVDPSILPYITGGGGALVVLCFLAWAFFVGKLHSDREFSKLEAESDRKDQVIERLQEALELERQRSNDVAQAGAVTNQLIGALTTVLASQGRQEHQEIAAKADARALDLIGKDLAV